MGMRAGQAVLKDDADLLLWAEQFLAGSGGQAHGADQSQTDSLLFDSRGDGVDGPRQGRSPGTHEECSRRIDLERQQLLKPTQRLPKGSRGQGMGRTSGGQAVTGATVWSGAHGGKSFFHHQGLDWEENGCRGAKAEGFFDQGSIDG